MDLPELPGDSFMTPRTLADSSSPEIMSHLDHLQGEWLTVEGRRAGELFITGRTYTLRFLDGTYYKGTFDITADQSLQTMVMHIEEGPPKHQGKSAWCLYSLDVGLLRWCPTEPGSDERLTAFPDMEDARYLQTVFRRDIDLD
jgi:hypothetical protein